MTRAERSEYTSIKNSLKRFTPNYTTTLTIRTDGSAEFKKALHEHYTSLGFHPANIKVDTRMFDEKVRILYIYGLTWSWNGTEHSWTELYTDAERARFAAALN